MIAVGATAAAATTMALTSAGSATAKTATAAVTHACGYSDPVGPTNPKGIYKTLPPALKAVYSSDPGALTPSVWAHSKPVKGPWKIGFIQVAITNAYQQDLNNGMEEQFAKAKKKGLVTGSLVTDVPPTIAATTPEEQIQAVQQMVREGVNAIVIELLSAAPVVPAIDAAGKAGVPVIIADDPLPQAKYGVVVWSQNQAVADAGTLKIIGQNGGGSILIVRGIAASPSEAASYDQALADLKYCPNINVAASVYGDFNEATAKTVVQQYLAANPGSVSGVIQDGGMAAGVIQAFQADGKPIPPVSEGECYGGDLSWWLANQSTFKSFGACFNGYQGAYVFFNTALRVLAGDGPKYQTLSVPSPAITNANISQFATPGLSITSPNEVGGPLTAWCSDTCLNQYFNKSGTPGGL
jgi:ribose transport system substrate-binding protein